MARIMMFTPPPEFMHLNAEGRACFCRVQSRLRATGKWQQEYVFGLGPVASECALYLRFAREVRALKDVPPKNMRELEEDVEVTHRLAFFAGVRLCHIPLGLRPESLYNGAQRKGFPLRTRLVL